jgi:hypothetical protein
MGKKDKDDEEGTRKQELRRERARKDREVDGQESLTQHVLELLLRMVQLIAVSWESLSHGKWEALRQF